MEREKLSGEGEAHARTVHLRRCGSSRYIFHLVRQSNLRNSELEDKGSCSAQTGASFQISSVANWCQNSQKSRMVGLLNHRQEGRPFTEKLGIPEFTRLFSGSHFTYSFLFGQNPNFNVQYKSLWFVYGTWQLVEALNISRSSRVLFPMLSLEFFIFISLPVWGRLNL